MEKTTDKKGEPASKRRISLSLYIVVSSVRKQVSQSGSPFDAEERNIIRDQDSLSDRFGIQHFLYNIKRHYQAVWFQMIAAVRFVQAAVIHLSIIPQTVLHRNDACILHGFLIGTHRKREDQGAAGLETALQIRDYAGFVGMCSRT